MKLENSSNNLDLGQLTSIKEELFFTGTQINYYFVCIVSVKFGSLFYSLQGPKPFLGRVLLSTPVSKSINHSSLSLYLADGMLFHYSPFRMFFCTLFLFEKIVDLYFLYSRLFPKCYIHYLG
jgi:hypothetical protein